MNADDEFVGLDPDRLAAGSEWGTMERNARIDALCDKFEDACQAGRCPTVAQFLQSEEIGIDPGTVFLTLLRELLKLEAVYGVPSQPPSDTSESPTPNAAPVDGATIPRSTTAPLFPAIPGYELLDEIGRGGMGVVYRARQTNAVRIVALKLIRSGEHASAGELSRFRTEAGAVARLQHPHVVQVFEVGESGGQPFFSMEFCPGGTLAQQLAGGPLPARDAAALVEKLVLGVCAAHVIQVWDSASGELLPNASNTHPDVRPCVVKSAEPSFPASEPTGEVIATSSPVNTTVNESGIFGVSRRSHPPSDSPSILPISIRKGARSSRPVGSPPASGTRGRGAR